MELTYCKVFSVLSKNRCNKILIFVACCQSQQNFRKFIGSYPCYAKVAKLKTGLKHTQFVFLRESKVVLKNFI